MFTGSNLYNAGPDRQGNTPQYPAQGTPGGLAPSVLQPQFTGFPTQQQYGAPYQQQQPPNQQPPIPQQQQFQSFQQQQPPQLPPQQQYQQPSFLQNGQQMPSFQQQPTAQFPSQQQQQPQPTAARPQVPQPTGLTSSQVADSFRTSPVSKPVSQAQPSGRKIPSIRLSFITAQDQAKFEELFKSAVGSEQALSGDKARELLLRSKLPGDTLSQIWYVVIWILSCVDFPDVPLGHYQIRQSLASCCFQSLRLPCICAILNLLVKTFLLPFQRRLAMKSRAWSI